MHVPGDICGAFSSVWPEFVQRAKKDRTKIQQRLCYKKATIKFYAKEPIKLMGDFYIYYFAEDIGTKYNF